MGGAAKKVFLDIANEEMYDSVRIRIGGARKSRTGCE
jgi:hypothetical protein